jgi:nitrous oxidase accessory protein NosD
MIDPKDGSHADAIQFENLPYGTHYPMDDEVITDNWFYQGESNYGMQGVFLHGGQSPEQMLHRAVIERNTVCIAGQFNGVFLSGGVDFSVKDNYVVGQKSMKVFVQQGTNGVVSGNTTNNVDVGANNNVTIGKNNTIGVPRDCTLAAAHAAQTGAGAGPRATLGPVAAPQ